MLRYHAPVTGEQVQQAVRAAGIKWITSHDCSICGKDVGWVTDGHDLAYQSACNCSWSPTERREWDDAAQSINMQTRKSESHGDIAATVAKGFGIELVPVGSES